MTLSILCLGILSTASAEEKLFPLPSQLQDNVDFWTRIYGLYSSRQVVIHDKENLAVVYEVLNLNEFTGDSTDLNTKWDFVEQEKEKFRLALMRLHEMSKPIPLDSLNQVEFAVFIEWADVQDDGKYLRAFDNIRGQLGLCDRFRESVQRSGFYYPYIKEIFQSFQLPTELCSMPHVESLFNYKSYSKAGAAGIWQFIPHTGMLFLTINNALDERLDPVLATVAAAKLLQKSYNELGSWPLAITAYNHGLNGMKSAMQQFGNDDFGLVYNQYKSRSFGFASKNFYSEFLAALHVSQNHFLYFKDLAVAPPFNFQTIELLEPLKIAQAANIFSVPIDTLAAYNPAFRKSIVDNIVPIPAGYHFRLPYREGFDPREVLARHASTVESPVKAQPAVTPDSLITLQHDSVLILSAPPIKMPEHPFRADDMLNSPPRQSNLNAAPLPEN
ncbi:MAG: hypothetical protein EHM72_07115 [Calditrichaeota bacterium]|nr:MAG: hypothetical protein EHM72_07115 [Calditrichota bacterium]